MGLDPFVQKPAEQVTILVLFLRCLTRTLTRVECHRGKLEECSRVKLSKDFSLETHFVIVHEQVVNEFPKVQCGRNYPTFSIKAFLMAKACAWILHYVSVSESLQFLRLHRGEKCHHNVKIFFDEWTTYIISLPPKPSIHLYIPSHACITSESLFVSLPGGLSGRCGEYLTQKCKDDGNLAQNAGFREVKESGVR